MSQQSRLTPALDRARALIASGDLDPAQVLLERAVELGRENLGDDDPDVLTAQRELAGVYLRTDDPMAARRVLEDAYAAGQWRLGDSDPVLLHISHDLGVVAQELGNRHEARKAFGRVAEHGPAVFGSGHQLVARALTYLNEDPSSAAVRPDPPSPRRPAEPPVPPPVVTAHQQPAAEQARVTPLPVVPEQPRTAPPAVPEQTWVAPPVVSEQARVAPPAAPERASVPPAVPEQTWVAPPAARERTPVAPPAAPEQIWVAPPAVSEQVRVAPKPVGPEQVQDPAVTRRPVRPAVTDHGAGQGQSGRPDARAAMEQPTDVFPVARPVTAGDDGVPPVDTGSRQTGGHVGNPWSTAPQPPQPSDPRQGVDPRQAADPREGTGPRQGVPEQRQAFPEQRHSGPEQQGVPEQRQGVPQRRQDVPHQGVADLGQGSPRPPAIPEQRHGTAHQQPWHEPVQTPPTRWGQATAPQPQATPRQPHETTSGYGSGHPGYAGTSQPADHPGYPEAFQSAVHPGWQGALPVAVGAGHSYQQGRVDERPARGRGLAVGLTVVATLMAMIAVGALIVVLVDRERTTPVTPAAPVTPEVTVSATGPVLSGDPPTAVKLTDRGTSVTVTWSDPTVGRAPFVVMLGQEGQQLKPASNVGPGKTSARVSGLNPQLQYCFTVVAVYATDRYATSNQVCTKRN